MNNIKKISMHQLGYSLIELMVGLVIGLIATVVIMQTFSSFEGTKRTTTGVSDAQTNGSIALYSIQRELQYVGYGLPLMSGTMPKITVLPNEMTYADYTGKTQAEIDTLQDAEKASYLDKVAAGALAAQQGEVFSALRCDNTASSLSLDLDNDSTTPDVAINVNELLTPVSITDGVNSDSITMRYGTSDRGGLPTAVTGVTPPNSVAVKNNMSCRQGDVVLVTKEVKSSTACVLTKLTAASTNATLEASTDKVNVTSTTGIAINDRLSCLGQIRQITFDVNGNQLQRNNRPVISDIVSIQAQYGISSTINSEIVAEWKDAVAPWEAPSVANRNRIKAVRIAVVARNSLLEKEEVSQNCTGTAAGRAKVCAWGGNINLAGTDVGTDWTRYRYRVYEVAIPLRNILAATPQL